MEGTAGTKTFTDSSARTKTVNWVELNNAVGTINLSDAQKKFGLTSVLATNVSYLQTAPNTEFAFPGDFTIEGWIYPTSWANFDQVFGTSTGGIGIVRNGSSTGLCVNKLGTATRIATASSTLPPVNQWTHVAVTRSGDQLRLFQDGVLLGATTNTEPFSQNGFWIASANGSEVFKGYIDEVRVTKGVARYTEAFSPPTNAFPENAAVLPAGEYALDVAYSDECNVICLDDAAGTTYNDLILRTTPV